MMRQTGGSAVGETSTRSSSCAVAICECVEPGHDSDLLAVCSDDAQLAARDLFVAPDALGRWSSDASIL